MKGKTFRNPRTHNEAAQAADAEVIPLIRPARRVGNLPDAYDDVLRRRNRRGEKKPRKRWSRGGKA